MMVRQGKTIAVLILLVLITSSPVGWCASSEVAAFFEGRRMTIIVPVATGTGYDTQARMLAPFLEKHLKVKPVVKNIAGAGQLIGDNELYKSDPDGLTIGYLPVATIIVSEVGEAPGRAFEALKFSWIAQAVGEPYILYGRKDLPTFEQLVAKKTPLIFGSATDFTAMNADVVTKLFGLPWKIVKGFLGQAEMNASLIRNEIQVTGGYASTVYPLVKGGEMKALLVIDDKPWDRYPELPTLLTLGSSFTRDQLSMARALVGLDISARGIAGPPGIRQERLLFLRAKVNDALNDEKFMKQFEEVGGEKLARLPLDQFLSLLNGAVNAPPELRAIIKSYFAKTK